MVTFSDIRIKTAYFLYWIRISLYCTFLNEIRWQSKMQCGSVKILVFKPIISFVTVGYNDILAAVYVKELCQELVTSQMFGIS